MVTVTYSDEANTGRAGTVARVDSTKIYRLIGNKIGFYRLASTATLSTKEGDNMFGPFFKNRGPSVKNLKHLGPKLKACC